VTIKDSTIDNLWIKFPPTDDRIKIDGLPRGLIPEFDLKDAVSGIDLPYNVRLINTDLSKFKPEMLSTKAEITNSHAMVHPYDKTDLIIRSSTLYSFNNYGCDRMESFDTVFLDAFQLIHKPEFANGFEVEGGIIREGGYCDLIFHDSSIDSPVIVVSNYEGTIDGELKFISPTNLQDVQWVKGIVTRTYPVISDPLVDLTLKQGNSIIWTGKTDSEGKASFSLTFDNETYTDEFVLKDENTGISKSVNFLTDTPVYLTSIDSTTTIKSTSTILEEKNETGLDFRVILIELVVIILVVIVIYKKLM